MDRWGDDEGDEEVADDSVIERLNQISDWHRLSKELTLYAAKRAKARYWGPNGHAERLPKGYQADDLAKKAIADLFRGKRRWDPDQEPDLLEYLCGVVDSLLSNLLRSKEFTALKTSVDAVDVADCLPCAEPNPEERIQKAQIEGRLLDGLYERSAKDPLVRGILECLMEDEDRPREIAAKLNCSVSEVNNAKKRLSRMFDELRREAVANGLEAGAW